MDYLLIVILMQKWANNDIKAFNFKAVTSLWSILRNIGFTESLSSDFLFVA